MFSGQGAIELPPHLAATHAFHVSGTFAAVTLGDGRSLSFEGLPEPTSLVLVATAILIACTRTVRGTLGGVCAAFYTRIASAHVLESPERAQLYSLIGSQPGRHLRELQRTLGWGWGTVHYHLELLRRSGLVTLEPNGKHLVVYQRSDAARSARARLDVRGKAAAVYDALAAGAMTQAELQGALGLSRQLVAHHLGCLVEDHLVTVLPGRPKRYVRMSVAKPSERSISR
jgi:DNA-binding transcriptional ArsR family regulator